MNPEIFAEILSRARLDGKVRAASVANGGVGAPLFVADLVDMFGVGRLDGPRRVWPFDRAGYSVERANTERDIIMGIEGMRSTVEVTEWLWANGFGVVIEPVGNDKQTEVALAAVYELLINSPESVDDANQAPIWGRENLIFALDRRTVRTDSWEALASLTEALGKTNASALDSWSRLQSPATLATLDLLGRIQETLIKILATPDAQEAAA